MVKFSLYLNRHVFVMVCCSFVFLLFFFVVFLFVFFVCLFCFFFIILSSFLFFCASVRLCFVIVAFPGYFHVFLAHIMSKALTPGSLGLCLINSRLLYCLIDSVLTVLPRENNSIAK